MQDMVGYIQGEDLRTRHSHPQRSSEQHVSYEKRLFYDSFRYVVRWHYPPQSIPKKKAYYLARGVHDL
jgi:hypothetical protein